MTLTLSDGPLAAGAPETLNYRIDGPQHKLLFSPFPRRLRAVVGGRTLLDTNKAMLLHESNILPVAYVPVADVDFDMLAKTDHSTHCPFKGDASYWTISAPGLAHQNSVWGYEEPIEAASWLVGYVAMYWGHIDQWFDEDEEVFGHLRDPYHRVDVRPTSRGVRVTIGSEVVAETNNAQVLSETGFDNRYYIPGADVSRERFEKSPTTTHCPYKGDTEYWTLSGQQPVEDVAWSYASPFDESLRIAGHWSFAGDDVLITTM